MSNIPTDLLRTLVTVVDAGSFTRAAQTLGMTQPGVSAQIKRLQSILGNDLFDRSGHALSLTPKGELVVNYARRMLSINDLILHLAEPSPSARTIRLGVPEDFVGGHFPGVLAGFRRRWADLRFSIHHGGLDRQIQDLRQGLLDIAVGLSVNSPDVEARHRWLEPAVWLRGRGTDLDPKAPVPLVSFREDWVCHRVAVNALHRSGRESELVYTAPTLTSLAAAVGAGMGIMALVRSRVRLPDLMIWEDAPLPKLPELTWGIYVREGGERGPLDEIADGAAIALSQRGAAAAPRRSGQSVKQIPLSKRATG